MPSTTPLEHEVALLILSVALSAFLIPIAVVLFFFSTPRLRRRAVFILNVCGIALGLAVGAICVYNSTRYILGNASSPVSPNPSASFNSTPPATSPGTQRPPARTKVLACLLVLAPIAVQSILVLRVAATYPFRHITWTHLLAVYLPLLALKGGRIANAACLVNSIQRLQPWRQAWSSPNATAEALLQLVDDLFACALFLLRARQPSRASVPFVELQTHTQAPTVPASPWTRLVATPFWLALANFVFPVLFDLAQAVLSLALRTHTSMGEYILLANVYVQILAVLLATVWAAGTPYNGCLSPSRIDSGMDTQRSSFFPGDPRALGGTGDPGASSMSVSSITKAAFAMGDGASVSVRDSGTQLGDGEELRWLAVLGKAHHGRGPMEPSICSYSSIQYDHRGQPVFYAV